MKPWQKAIPKDRLAHIVKDATRALVRALTLRLAGHGVSFGHWTFLRILWEHDGLTQRELSEQAGVMEPTTFSAIKAMEELGYVERRRSPQNRKNMYVHLTPHGRALKDKLVPLAEEVNRVATRGVAAEDLAATRRALLAVLGNLAEEVVENATPRKSPGTSSPRCAGTTKPTRFSSRPSPRKPSPLSRISGSSRGSSRYRRPA